MAYSKANISNKQRREELKDVKVARNEHRVCVFVLMFVFFFNGLVPKQGRDPNVSARFRVAARICLGSVLGRHDRDPNVSTHFRIAAVLWDQIIKSSCVCVYFCVNFV